MAYRLAAEQAEREQVLLGRKQARTITEGEEGRKADDVWDKELTKGFGIGGVGGAVKGQEEEETRERVFYRLDGLGYRVGQGLVERFSRDKPRFQDTLDAIKFLCKDIWIMVFKKQIDNLKTNHRGVYVLTDARFHPLTKISHERGREGILAQAQPVSIYHVPVLNDFG